MSVSLARMTDISNDMLACRAQLFRRFSASELRNQREILGGSHACDNLSLCRHGTRLGYVLRLTPSVVLSCLIQSVSALCVAVGTRTSGIQTGGG